MKKVDRWKMEMPTEQEMLPKDKYTVFDRKVKRYRKGIHSESIHLAGYKDMLERLGSTIGSDGMGLGRSGDDKQTLTICRGTEVDKSQPETEPSWFLSGQGWFCVHYMLLYGLHGIWRFSGIKDIPNSTFAYEGHNTFSTSVDSSLHRCNNSWDLRSRWMHACRTL